MLRLDNRTFSENLALTQEYCEQQIGVDHKSNAAILRTINPVTKGKSLFHFRYSNFEHPGMRPNFFQTDWAVDPFDQRERRLIEQLFEIQLDVKRVNSHPKRKTAVLGEVLISKIDETVIDGASSVMSNGLVDDFDMPPIDTWFYLHQSKAMGRLLFAWIPQRFGVLANEAVLVNCMDCLGWYKDWFPEDYESSLQYYVEYCQTSNP